MNLISPNIEAYGSYARASALADFLELAALKGRTFTVADVSAYLQDNNWRLRDAFRRQVGSREVSATEVEVEEEPDVDDSPVESASEVFSQGANRVVRLLEERSTVLGKLYPFRLTDRGLIPRRNADTNPGPYQILLALTAAHAYQLEVPHDPKRLLERVVHRVVSRRGWLCADFANQRRSASSFAGALDAVGNVVQLVIDPLASSTSRAAQDAGVDTIAHFSWGDWRPGKWVVIGQVTCAKSDEWRAKLLEPSIPAWKRRFGEAPAVFLAVPHHIEPDHLRYLLDEAEGIVLDRLRMARHMPQPTREELALTRAVLRSRVEA